MIHWFDITFLIFLTLVVPVLAVWSFRSLQRQLAAGETAARLTDYRSTILWEWAVVAVLLLFWFAVGRSAGDLGFAPVAGWGFWLGLAVVAALALGLFGQERRARSQPETRGETRQQMGAFEDFAPRTERELKTFSLLSVTAGICEEIVYRGYLMWLLAGFANVWVAVLGSSLVFAACHLYQGWSGAIRVFVLGTVMAGLYLLTGSLWVPILLHAVVDLAMGRLAFIVFDESEPDEALPAAA